jgi:diamine N-acetyltransferase
MIVRASLAEVRAIQQVAYQTWPDTFKEILTPAQIDYMLNWMYNTESLSASIQHPHQAFWLYQENGETLGFAGIEHHFDGKNATKLHKIYVLPQAQGKQIGKQLLEKVISEARNAGSTALLLNVNRYNNATAFYERQGFIITNEVNIDIGNGYLMEDYEMELSITND